MANLWRKVQDLEEHFYCPEHRDEPLLCSKCDMRRLSPEEWDELALLLEQAGYLDRPAFGNHRTCWRCGEGDLACLECLKVREDPPGLALMRDADLDRMYELAAKLAPPWLSAS